MSVKKAQRKTVLVLHNIRSVQNVGAIFRTADAAGIFKIYCVGYTPTPLDRFGRVRGDFIKASLGGEKYVAWEKVKSAGALLKRLQKEKFEIVCLEQSPNSLDYKRYKLRRDWVLWVGNEVTGVAPYILGKADQIVEIPMRGKKESLNVSTALGIALFRILNL